jgi:hypothetical protein
MDQLLETIRAATAPGASDEARAVGAQACRTILAALEAKAGEPLAHKPPPATPLQAVVAALSNTPPEQLLDLAITKLKAALPTGTELRPVQRLNLPLLPVHALRGGK